MRTGRLGEERSIGVPREPEAPERRGSALHRARQAAADRLRREPHRPAAAGARPRPAPPPARSPSSRRPAMVASAPRQERRRAGEQVREIKANYGKSDLIRCRCMKWLFDIRFLLPLAAIVAVAALFWNALFRTQEERDHQHKFRWVVGAAVYRYVADILGNVTIATLATILDLYAGGSLS